MSSFTDVVNEVCLGLPETETATSHGFPVFRVRGKQFATYSVNHHGDGKVSLLLNASRETQQMLVSSAPVHFFVPPYIGTRGWVGVELNKGLSWDRISQLTHEAYCRTAPTTLARDSEPVKVKPPTEKLRPEDIDPLQSAANQKIIKQLRDRCLKLPEVIEDKQFGNPSFKAGKKSFCGISAYEGVTKLQIWVGVDRQVALTSFDDRFEVPQYMGHHGWINLNLMEKQNWQEIQDLLEISYRHFALKRMLKVLDEG
jgi:hypothetical protein